MAPNPLEMAKIRELKDLASESEEFSDEDFSEEDNSEEEDSQGKKKGNAAASAASASAGSSAACSPLQIMVLIFIAIVVRLRALLDCQYHVAPFSEWRLCSSCDFPRRHSVCSTSAASHPLAGHWWHVCRIGRRDHLCAVNIEYRA